MPLSDTYRPVPQHDVVYNIDLQQAMQMVEHIPALILR